MSFLPITREDMDKRGWDELDFLYISGDAYVDHPSFGHSIITRLLESEGYRVGIIPQPQWKTTEDFLRLGKPRLGVLISSGVIDSMVNHYTASKKKRSDDLYTPGGKANKRPDRAVIVYTNKIREVFKDVPVIIGGIEASLRRFAHYDYWEDKVRRSILLDSGGDLLIYGMGERPILEIAKRLKDGVPVNKIRDVKGTAYIDSYEGLPESIRNAISSEKEDKKVQVGIIPSFEEVAKSKKEYAKAFMIQYNEQDPFTGKILIQKHWDRYLVQNSPALPLDEKWMDRVYSLPYERTYHPSYESEGGIPAITEVEFSITSHRGCYGGCSFCALNFHQGRIIQRRSQASIINEAKKITWAPGFKGYIHDIGGPTANFRSKACKKQETQGVCKNKQCLYPKPCENLIVDHSEYLSLLRKLRQIPTVKKVFIRSGIRFDYLMLDKKDDFFIELCKHHVSGQLKVAPEHVVDRVLNKMGKPQRSVYDRFVKKFYDINKRLNKEQYLVPYLISSHPGSDINAAVELALYLKDLNYTPQQVQDFYPTPGTLSTCMFYTGIDPRTMESVYVPKSFKEKTMQRALLQYRKAENYELVLEALKLAHREDLIGYGKNCLIKPRGGKSKESNRGPGGTKEKSSPNKIKEYGRRGKSKKTTKDLNDGSSGKGGKRRNIDNKNSDNKRSENKINDNKRNDNKRSENKINVNKRSENKRNYNKRSDNKRSDIKMNDNKRNDSKRSDNKMADNKRSGNKRSENKKSDNKRNDNKKVKK